MYYPTTGEFGVVYKANYFQPSKVEGRGDFKCTVAVKTLKGVRNMTQWIMLLKPSKTRESWLLSYKKMKQYYHAGKSILVQ